MSRILLLEDHDRLARLMCKALRGAGIAVDVVERIDSAWDAVGRVSYQALVLDRGLPDGDGLGLLRRLRAAGQGLPCLVLTARDALHDRVEGLDAGADDYLPKPFAIAELEARILALIRRSRGRAHPRLQCGALVFDGETRSFTLGGAPLALTPRESTLLGALLARSGQPLTKAQLLDKVFSLDADVSPDAIEVLVYRLRKKLAGHGVTIVTLRGFGYLLEPEAET